MTDPPDPTAPFDQRGQHVDFQVNVAPGGRADVHLPGPPPRRFANVPPAPTQALIGRDTLLADLIADLIAGQARTLSTDGQGGAGKTALALAVAYHPAITAHFTGGVLWASLGPSGSPTNAIGAWAEALGVEVTHLPTLDQRRDQLLRALDDHPLLVILDDLWDLAAANALRLARPNVDHLLTTRDAALAAAFAGEPNRRHVPDLDPDPAFTLLQSLAPQACATDPAQARQLVRAVGGLPLALVLLGGYLAATGSNRFATQQQAALQRAGDPATRLALACARLGDGSGSVVKLADVIALSLHALPDPVRAAFYALGALAPKPATFDLAAATAVTGADEETLGTLIDRNLLELDTGETGAAETGAGATDAGKAATGERLAVHQVVANVARTHTPSAALAAHDRYYLELINADEEDWQRIETVYHQANHAMQRLAQGDAHILDWVWALGTFWQRRGLGVEYIRWARFALAIADAAGDTKTLATLFNNIGWAYDSQGDKQQALDYCNQALPLFRQMGNMAGEANTLSNIGHVYYSWGDKQRALDYYNHALPLQRQVGDKAGEANTLNHIGVLHASVGEKHSALVHYTHALSLRREVNDRSGEAQTLSNIGAVYADLGNMRQAMDYYNEALLMRRQIGDKTGEAQTLSNIGYVSVTLGDLQRAIDYFNQALSLQTQTSDKNGEATTLNNLGTVCTTLGEQHRALDYFTQAMLLYRQVGDKSGEANALNNIGTVYWQTGDLPRGFAHLAAAVDHLHQIGDRFTEVQGRYNLAYAADALGDRPRALAELRQAIALAQATGHPLLPQLQALLAEWSGSPRGG